jgi:hypothetical protein
MVHVYRIDTERGEEEREREKRERRDGEDAMGMRIIYIYIQCIASTIVWVSPDMAHISKLRGGC